MKENLLIDKSIAFAARIVKLHQHLIKNKKEAVISKQIVRSGTSIGANINEANYGQSKSDFISKMHIALFFGFSDGKTSLDEDYKGSLTRKKTLLDRIDHIVQQTDSPFLVDKTAVIIKCSCSHNIWPVPHFTQSF